MIDAIRLRREVSKRKDTAVVFERAERCSLRSMFIEFLMSLVHDDRKAKLYTKLRPSIVTCRSALTPFFAQRGFYA